MIAYDPRIILEMAGKLYQKAESTILGYTVVFGLIGIVVGCLIGFRVDKDAVLFVSVTSAALMGVIGYAIGREKAFYLMFEAQKFLCQAEIESHLRRLALGEAYCYRRE